MSAGRRRTSVAPRTRRGPRDAAAKTADPLVFVGGGNMASALVGGLLARERPSASISIVEVVASQREHLHARFPGVDIHASLSPKMIARASAVVLCVKPQQMRDTARSLAAHVENVPVVLSIAAGIRIRDLSRWLGGYARIVRAMPNTPALVGHGISGACAARAVDPAAHAVADAILSAVGDVVWCTDERSLDGVTGVSGSGPAYVFYWLESLEAAARELGFTADVARKLAYSTFAGAVALAQKSPEEPAVLRANVTSKGGTTARALEVLERAGVKATLVEAVKAAAERAGELGDEFGKD
jgi:pyrroline-5-carboxylate reductase